MKYQEHLKEINTYDDWLKIKLINLTILEKVSVLKKITGYDYPHILCHKDTLLNSREKTYLSEVYDKLIHHYPLPYILKQKEFYGLMFYVDEGCLIPRSCTEALVDFVIQDILNRVLDNPISILDLGTGSGCIGLSIAKLIPQVLVYGIDISDSALNIAEKNKKNLKIENCHFIKSDWFSSLKGRKFNILISNPPYIDLPNDKIDPSICYEPFISLFAQEEGLKEIKNIIEQASVFIHDYMIIEHSPWQAKKVTSFMLSKGYRQIRSIYSSNTLRATQCLINYD